MGLFEGKSEPLMKDGRRIGTRWEDGSFSIDDPEAIERMLRISPETQQQLEEIDRHIIVAPHPLRR